MGWIGSQHWEDTGGASLGVTGMLGTPCLLFKWLLSLRQEAWLPAPQANTPTALSHRKNTLFHQLQVENSRESVSVQAPAQSKLTQTKTNLRRAAKGALYRHLGLRGGSTAFGPGGGLTPPLDLKSWCQGTSARTSRGRDTRGVWLHKHCDLPLRTRPAQGTLHSWGNKFLCRSCSTDGSSWSRGA